jgi:hypothetical protein
MFRNFNGIDQVVIILKIYIGASIRYVILRSLLFLGKVFPLG